jgi:hypothetical protein
MVARAPWRDREPEVGYLWWMSAPVFLFFLLFGLRTGGGEPNWPVTAYLSGAVLAAGWLRDWLAASSGWRRRVALGWVGLACVLGVVLQLVLAGPAWARPVVVALAGEPTEERPVPLRRLDPTCRLRGWRTLAAEVDRVRDELRAEGHEPLLAGSSWNVPGELGFYCVGRPRAFSLGLAAGDRHSQYDLWRPNPVHDPEHFRGRTFIHVGEPSPALRAAFDHVEPPRAVRHEEGGQPVAVWKLTVCRGYRGLAPPRADRY